MNSSAPTAKQRGPLLDRRRLLRGAALAGAAIATSPVRAAGASYDPRDYGARGIGDGFDDTPAIQAAIDAAARAGGGDVVIRRPRAFYRIGAPLVMRPRVSLIGDGSTPRLVQRGAGRYGQMLSAGNFHPDFISRARYHPAAPTVAGSNRVVLERAEDAAQYRVGDQVYVASRRWGKTGGFGLPQHGWINLVTAREGRTLILREAIDVAVSAQVARLGANAGRGGTPLRFHSDARIAGLSFDCDGHLMNDSALLRVEIEDNVVAARTGTYGNCFQHVRWQGNRFTCGQFGELSLTSYDVDVIGNDFRYDPRSTQERFMGFYLQEYGRKLRLRDNTVDVGNAVKGEFLLSIARAQDVLVERLSARGRFIPSLIFMGTASEPGFPIRGNMVRDCRFEVDRVTRYVMVDAAGSAATSGNGIVGCLFGGTSEVDDAIRIQNTPGEFTFDRNHWTGRGQCFTMGRTRAVSGNRNGRSSPGSGSCRPIGN